MPIGNTFYGMKNDVHGLIVLSNSSLKKRSGHVW